MIGVSRLYEQGAGLIGGGFPRLSIFTVQNYETLKLWDADFFYQRKSAFICVPNVMIGTQRHAYFLRDSNRQQNRGRDEGIEDRGSFPR